jgi:hypothetical protein
LSQSPAVRGPSRSFSIYNVRASVHRYVRLIHISDSTTKNGVNQEAQFPKKKRSTPKQTGQTLLRLLASGTYCCRFTTDKVKAAVLRVILEWLATTHESDIPKHYARSAVRAWYQTNGVDVGLHDANVLSHDNGGQQGCTRSP